MLKLQSGEQVLDVGSGLGGGALYMAENYDVDVVGLDLSTNMVHIALGRAISCQNGSVSITCASIEKSMNACNLLFILLLLCRTSRG